jgi:hypothetical protein
VLQFEFHKTLEKFLHFLAAAVMNLFTAVTVTDLIEPGSRLDVCKLCLAGSNKDYRGSGDDSPGCYAVQLSIDSEDKFYVIGTNKHCKLCQGV